MQIPSGFSSGVQGLQSAQSGLTQATVDVAKPTPTQSTPPAEPTRAVAESDKSAALVSATESLRQGEAAAEVIDVESENLGTIINIQV